jgi:hypothetical protein
MEICLKTRKGKKKEKNPLLKKHYGRDHNLAGFTNHATLSKTKELNIPKTICTAHS